jgi:ATP-dependent DNA helicase RecG
MATSPQVAAARSSPVHKTLFAAPAMQPASAPKAPGKLAKARAAAAGSGDELGRLKRLGFSTLAECLLSAPKAFLDYTQPIKRVLGQHVGKQQYLVLTLSRMRVFDRDGRSTNYWKAAFRVELETRDEAGLNVKIAIFGNCWPCKDLEPGDVLHVHGDLKFAFGRFELERPSFVAPRDRGRVAVLYRGKSGQVSGDALGEGVQRALHRIEDSECLLLAQAGLRESEFLEQTKISGQELLRRLHSPKSVAEGLSAVGLARKLAAEAVVRRAANAKTRPPVAASAIPIGKDLVRELIAELPFKLTADQVVAIDEIVADLRCAYPMRRLLSGDVGTGKSIVFMIPAAAAYAAGAEVAILAPSQLIVSQLAREFRENFPGLPVCEVIAGGKIGEGVCVGTTALLKAAAKVKKSFSLVVTDEQHKFSVDQKSTLVSKRTNVLESTATAIPRTLAMVNFGGMDVSLLRECPVVKKITTRVTTDSDVDRVDVFIDKIIAQKGQVAVIYPLVAEGDDKTDEDMVSVVEAGQAWAQRFPGRVGVLHGKMTAEDKAQVITAMHAGKFDILVSSLVIEVGVTLPSLKVMVVTSPERFGVSQLHQLRGRVARKGGNGYMLLHASAQLQDGAAERLRLLCEHSDGFTLAERDMDLRGFGDVEDDSESQTGSTRALFWGLSLTHKELKETAVRMGFADSVK